MNPDINTQVLSLYRTDPGLAQYLIYNLFRILRPLRYKYKLTINEVVILNGVYLYHKHVAGSFSRRAIRRYNGYFNNNKSDYYINTLVEKGCVSVCEMRKDIPYYKITEKGISIVNEFENCYQIALMKYISDNSISL